MGSSRNKESVFCKSSQEILKGCHCTAVLIYVCYQINGVGIDSEIYEAAHVIQICSCVEDHHLSRAAEIRYV